MRISLFWAVSLVALVVFCAWWTIFWFPRRRDAGYFFFDAQDSYNAKLRNRTLPASAEKGTFEPLLKHYIGVTQLLITVAAASIAFGANTQQVTPIVIAKLLLAWSIFFGVLFSALLLYRYDEYSQDLESYTLPWYSTIFAFGFSSLSCFVVGYLAWGYGLSSQH